ncbi:MAG: MarR family winged helix-turn-helix transcriptional regulator [Bacteriovoracaceae bacterium]|nr:MarR family winged helix-turn-helix transcriptional regulator [Bacteriovoracaceae bacterium]
MSQKSYSNRNKLEKMLDDPKVVSWRIALNTVEELYEQFDKKLNEVGCNMSRFEMLFFIYFKGPLSAIQLAAKMRVSRGNISAFLKRLKVDGLIEPCKMSSTATRPKFVLSEKGEEYFDEIFKLHLKQIKSLVSPLTGKLQEELSLWAKK